MADFPVLGGLGETKEVSDDVRDLTEKVRTSVWTGGSWSASMTVFSEPQNRAHDSCVSGACR